MSQDRRHQLVGPGAPGGCVTQNGRAQITIPNDDDQAVVHRIWATGRLRLLRKRRRMTLRNHGAVCLAESRRMSTGLSVSVLRKCSGQLLQSCRRTTTAGVGCSVFTTRPPALENTGVDRDGDQPTAAAAARSAHGALPIFPVRGLMVCGYGDSFP
jgi:hypothetical protein